MRIKTLNSDDVEEQKYFEKLLLEIGNGTFPSIDDNVNLPEKIFHKNSNLSLFLADFYDQYENFGSDLDLIFNRAILSTKVEYVNEINQKLIKKFPGENQLFLSSDSVHDEKHSHLYSAEFLNKLEPSGLPSHKLNIKIKFSYIIYLLIFLLNVSN